MPFVFVNVRTVSGLDKGKGKMATSWFCKLMGKTEGPLKPSELMEMIRNEEVTAATPVRKNNSDWVPASEVMGLFEAAYKDQPEKVKQIRDTEYQGDY